MHPDTAEFLTYLRTYQGKDALVEPAVAALMPFLERVDANGWVMDLGDAFDASAASAAIAAATGAAPGSITAFGLNGTLSAAPETHDAFVGRFGLADRVFANEIESWVVPASRRHDGVESKVAVHRMYDHCLRKRIMCAFLNGQNRSVMAVNLMVHYYAMINATIATIVVPYCYFALRGAAEQMERLEPAVKLLPHALPFGRSVSDPEAWVVAILAPDAASAVDQRRVQPAKA